MPIVYINILTWNRRDLAVECIRSVLRSKTKFKYKIIVIDNNSIDDTVNYITKYYPMVHVIKNKENLGWSGGNNRGISYSLKNKADYIILLNNDITLDRKCVEELINELEKNRKVDILSPKIYRYPKKSKVISNAGNFYDKHHYGTMHGAGKIDNGMFNNNKSVDFVAGVVCARSIVYLKTGMLDEKYFLYFEDTDFCERARKLGFRFLFVSKAIQYHHESATNGIDTPLFVYYNTRNHLLFIRKHFTRDLFKEIIYTLHIISHDLKHGNRNWYFEFKGLKDFFLNRLYQRKYW